MGDASAGDCVFIKLISELHTLFQQRGKGEGLKMSRFTQQGAVFRLLIEEADKPVTNTKQMLA